MMLQDPFDYGAEMTTQAAAELLGCSRPHVVKLLEQGKIPFTKIGKHRRVRYDDVMKYRKAMKEAQRQLLKDMMRDDEEAATGGDAGKSWANGIMRDIE